MAGTSDNNANYPWGSTSPGPFVYTSDSTAIPPPWSPPIPAVSPSFGKYDPLPEHFSSEYLMEMIRMRMRWDPSPMLGDFKYPFAALTAIREGDRVAVVVLQTGQEAIVLEDEWGLFPSDRLVTQLRLLEGK
jgi:hypothetical protein